MSAEVSAVVVNYDGQRTLNRTIEALLGQTLELQRIVVVDSGSSDDSLEKLEIAYPDVDVVHRLELALEACAGNHLTLLQRVGRLTLNRP